MLWKILLLTACAVAVWRFTRPKNPQNNGDDKIQNLALCPKCGVYHHPDSPCQSAPRDSDSPPPTSKPS